MTARVWNSLRWRLPFLIAVVITVVAGTVLVLAVREVQSSLLAAAGVRARGAADQIATLLSQSTQQRFLELRTLANDGALASFLEQPSDDTKRAAEARLSKLASPNPQVIEVWNRARQRVF